MKKSRGSVLVLVLSSLLVSNSFAQGIIKDDFKVNDDTMRLDQDMPDIDVDDLGYFVIVWQDPRNNGTDVFAQRLNPSGEVSGGNYMINNELNGYQKYPSIAYGSAGDFVVVWQDSREGNRDVYAQKFNAYGDTLDSNFRVNQDLGTKPQIEPEVGFSAILVVVWEDQRLDDSDIFAQLLEPSGQFKDTNFKVNDDTGTSTQLRSDVALDARGNFVVVWQDKREENYDIYAQRFDSSGNFLDVNFRVNDDLGSSLQNFPKVDSDSPGNFVVVWQDKRNGDEDIFAQIYNWTGEKDGENFRVNDDMDNAYQGHPDVAMNKEGNFVVVWVDKRNGDKDIYAQRYDVSFNPLGVNFRVNSDTGSADQSEPAVATDGERIFFTWVDGRNSDLDIFAKAIDWNWTYVNEIDIQDDISSFVLSQNFPNPFNLTTTIQSTVHSKRKTAKSPIHTTLKIYNIRGRLVKTLVNEDLKPGTYTVIWDGKDNRGSEVASGIYFYRLKSEDCIETKKMLFLK